MRGPRETLSGELMYACGLYGRELNFEAARAALAAGAWVDGEASVLSQRDCEHYHPLSLAVKNGHAGLVELLLNAGATILPRKVGYSEYPPAHEYAVQQGTQDQRQPARQPVGESGLRHCDREPTARAQPGAPRARQGHFGCALPGTGPPRRALSTPPISPHLASSRLTSLHLASSRFTSSRPGVSQHHPFLIRSILVERLGRALAPQFRWVKKHKVPARTSRVNSPVNSRQPTAL